MSQRKNIPRDLANDIHEGEAALERIKYLRAIQAEQRKNRRPPAQGEIKVEDLPTNPFPAPTLYDNLNKGKLQ